MSVKVGERKENNLNVLNDIRVLGEYTIKACRSEKVFPKSSRWIMAKPIVDECLSAFSCVRRANSVIPVTQGDYNYRRNQQVQARAHLESMLALVDLAYTSFNIEPKKIEYWTGLVLNAETRLKSWMKSDQERYKKL